MSDELFSLSAHLFPPTIWNTLFPPTQSLSAESLDQVLFLDENASSQKLTRRLLLQSSHAFARGLRDARGVAYLWFPFRKGDSVGVVVPGLEQNGSPLGWEWSLLECVIAVLGILKAGGTVRLYRATDGLGEKLRIEHVATQAVKNAGFSIDKDLTVPESVSPAPPVFGQPPHHLTPPLPRLLITPPTLPIRHLPNLFYGHPEIPESVAWRNGTRPLTDMCERGALMRDEVLPTLTPEDAERWAVWSEDEGRGWRHVVVGGGVGGGGVGGGFEGGSGDVVEDGGVGADIAECVLGGDGGVHAARGERGRESIMTNM